MSLSASPGNRRSSANTVSCLVCFPRIRCAEYTGNYAAETDTMNGNDAPNVKDLRETVFDCARQFLTDVSAPEIADLVIVQIETADCLELIDDDVTWERVEAPLPTMSRATDFDLAVACAAYEQYEQYAA